MSESTFPDVHVVAVAIKRGSAFLTVFNIKWGAFTLPMTKRRALPDRQTPNLISEEDGSHAAVRAAAEALGRPVQPTELPRPLALAELQPFQQSDRDGTWKRFRFEVFQMEVGPNEKPEPVGGGPIAWLTLEELRNVQPVSPTAERIAAAVEGAAVLERKR